MSVALSYTNSYSIYIIRYFYIKRILQFLNFLPNFKHPGHLFHPFIDINCIGWSSNFGFRKATIFGRFLAFLFVLTSLQIIVFFSLNCNSKFGFFLLNIWGLFNLLIFLFLVLQWVIYIIEVNLFIICYFKDMLSSSDLCLWSINFLVSSIN